MRVFMIVVLLFSLVCAPAYADKSDKVVSDNLIFPQKMVVMDGADYVFDEGQLVRVTDSGKEVLASISDVAELKSKGIQDSDLTSFRPANMLANNGTVYVSGLIHRDYGNGDGTGAIYHMILAWNGGKFKLIVWGRGQDAPAPVLTDWNDGENPQLLSVGGKWVYDYLKREYTRPAMSIVNNHLYYVYFAHDMLNKEGLAWVDLSDPGYKVHKIVEDYGFDTLSQAYYRSDYWQGYGPAYTVIPAADEKSVTIIDGDHDIYKYDIVRRQMKLVSRFYNAPDASKPLMTKTRIHNGVNYYLNDQGIYKQSDLKERPVKVFDPHEYHWSIDGGIGAIADWDFIDDSTIALLDYTNHRVVHAKLFLDGDE